MSNCQEQNVKEKNPHTPLRQFDVSRGILIPFEYGSYIPLRTYKLIFNFGFSDSPNQSKAVSFYLLYYEVFNSLLFESSKILYKCEYLKNLVINNESIYIIIDHVGILDSKYMLVAY